jgi:hypothetical protein
MTEFISKRPVENNKDETTLKIPINFYVSRLNSTNKRAHGYCLVM